MVWKGQNDNWICLIVQSECKDVTEIHLILIYKKEDKAALGEVSCNIKENMELSVSTTVPNDGMIFLNVIKRGFDFNSNKLNLEVKCQDNTETIRLTPPQKGFTITDH